MLPQTTLPVILCGFGENWSRWLLVVFLFVFPLPTLSWISKTISKGLRYQLCEVILEWAAALPDLLAECGSCTPNLGATSEDCDFAAWGFSPWDRERSFYNLKYGSLPCSYQGAPSEAYCFKGNGILLLQDCPCKYLVVQANQTCSPSCSLQPHFQKTRYALMHHSANDWVSSSSGTLEWVKSVYITIFTWKHVKQ